ncbi:MAG TPA: hypothetical protein ENJ95_06850 [Bacteroidetes bacterium]|nr:hypothetical protein [Bacteroidota bacterium]
MNPLRKFFTCWLPFNLGALFLNVFDISALLKKIFSHPNKGCTTKIYSDIWASIFILFVVFSFGLSAQDNNIRFKHITLEDGLLQSSIQCMYQDSRGFVWIGTEDGLHKYDGYEFKIFRHIPGDSTSLSNNSIIGIAEDASGNLWIGTKSGLNFFEYETGTLTYLDSIDLSHSTITSLLFDLSNNSLWVGSEGGLDYFIIPNKITDSILVHHVPIDFKGVGSLFLDSEKDLWIGSRSGLFKMDKNINIPILIPSIEKNHIYSIAEDKNGFIWIGKKGGVEKFKKDSLESTLEQVDLKEYCDFSKYKFLLVFSDQSGNIWIGTNRGLLQFSVDNGSFTKYSKRYGNPNSLNSHFLYCMLQDESGLYWIGTHGGLNLLNLKEQRFPHHRIPYQENLGDDALYIRSILEDKNGTVWIGTQGAGLFFMEKGQGSPQPFLMQQEAEYITGAIKAIVEDRYETIWLGTVKMGLVRVNQKSRKLVRQKVGLSRTDALLADRDGYIWTEHRNSLIHRFNPQNQDFFQMTDGAVQGVRSLAQDSSGIVWIGTDHHGLFKYNPTTNKYPVQVTITGQDSLFEGYNKINYILPDDMGIIWIGTYGGGLVRLDTRRDVFSFFNSSNTKLPNDIIYGILKDDNGNL